MKQAYVIWNGTKDGTIYAIGVLSQLKNKYRFKYVKDLEKAKMAGFNLIVSFPDENKIYESVKLFNFFNTRLPYEKRNDMVEILKKYNMPKYDAFDLLVKSGSKLPIDSIFLAPLTSNKGNKRGLRAKLKLFF